MQARRARCTHLERRAIWRWSSTPRWALWALARDGRAWEVMFGEFPLAASLVKSYIRHDLFVQRMYTDLPSELENLYGPGLLELTNLSEGEADPGAVAASES
jgi:hypothetical protein